jgi:hypothetical protein
MPMDPPATPAMKSEGDNSAAKPTKLSFTSESKYATESSRKQQESCLATFMRMAAISRIRPLSSKGAYRPFCEDFMALLYSVNLLIVLHYSQQQLMELAKSDDAPTNHEYGDHLSDAIMVQQLGMFFDTAYRFLWTKLREHALSPAGEDFLQGVPQGNFYYLWHIITARYEPTSTKSRLNAFKQLYTLECRGLQGFHAFLKSLNELCDQLQAHGKEYTPSDDTMRDLLLIACQSIPEFAVSIELLTDKMDSGAKVHYTTLRDKLETIVSTQGLSTSMTPQSYLAGASSTRICRDFQAGKCTRQNCKFQHKKSESACSHCNKPGHSKDECFTKHPELRPKHVSHFTFDDKLTQHDLDQLNDGLWPTSLTGIGGSESESD